jgi:hypothetical protein
MTRGKATFNNILWRPAWPRGAWDSINILQWLVEFLIYCANKPMISNPTSEHLYSYTRTSQEQFQEKDTAKVTQITSHLIEIKLPLPHFMTVSCCAHLEKLPANLEVNTWILPNDSTWFLGVLCIVSKLILSFK